jgi:ParB family transcriptional regulator, chromosome partitioning protein
VEAFYADEIDSNILLALKDAPFNKRNVQLVPAAGSCADCSKRTGHNKLLLGDDLGRQGDTTLGDSEQAAIEDGVVAYENLLLKLADVPTPAGPTQK